MILRMKPIRLVDRKVSALLGRAGARFQGLKAPRSAKFFGAPVVDLFPGSRVEIGERVTMYSKARLHPNGCSFPCQVSTRQAESRITIGDDSALAGVVLVARADITIGSRVMIGPDCRLYAGKVHRTDEVNRRHVPPEPRDHANDIVIEDDVFIGAWVMVMAGVTVGPGSVIGAGSVVTKDIPPLSVAAGSPAKVIRQISAPA